MKIFIIFLIVSVLLLILFFIACLRISSECSRAEERRDFYKVIGTDIERETISEEAINKKII